MNDKMIESLQKMAKRKTWEEVGDFNPYEQSGGNFDDAYSGGYDDGCTDTARMILEELSIEY